MRLAPFLLPDILLAFSAPQDIQTLLQDQVSSFAFSFLGAGPADAFIPWISNDPTLNPNVNGPVGMAQLTGLTRVPQGVQPGNAAFIGAGPFSYNLSGSNPTQGTLIYWQRIPAPAGGVPSLGVSASVSGEADPSIAGSGSVTPLPGTTVLRDGVGAIQATTYASGAGAPANLVGANGVNVTATAGNLAVTAPAGGININSQSTMNVGASGPGGDLNLNSLAGSVGIQAATGLAMVSAAGGASLTATTGAAGVQASAGLASLIGGTGVTIQAVTGNLLINAASGGYQEGVDSLPNPTTPGASTYATGQFASNGDQQFSKWITSAEGVAPGAQTMALPLQNGKAYSINYRVVSESAGGADSFSARGQFDCQADGGVITATGVNPPPTLNATAGAAGWTLTPGTAGLAFTLAFAGIGSAVDIRTVAYYEWLEVAHS